MNKQKRQKKFPSKHKQMPASLGGYKQNGVLSGRRVVVGKVPDRGSHSSPGWWRPRGEPSGRRQSEKLPESIADATRGLLLPIDTRGRFWQHIKGGEGSSWTQTV